MKVFYSPRRVQMWIVSVLLITVTARTSTATSAATETTSTTIANNVKTNHEFAFSARKEQEVVEILRLLQQEDLTQNQTEGVILDAIVDVDEEVHDDDDDEEHHDEEEHHDDGDEENHDDDDEEHHDEDEYEDHLHEEAHHGNTKPWKDVIVTSLLINCASLIGIVVIAMTRISHHIEQHMSSRVLTRNLIPSFACGALLATTFFLIVPEALAMLNRYFEEENHGDDDHDDHDHRWLQETEDSHEGHTDDSETAVAWRFGVSILCGFLIPVVASLFFPEHEDDQHDDIVLAAAHAKVNTATEETNMSRELDETATTPQEQETTCTTINYQLAASILLGDFFHNFTDGVLIGTSFTLCNRQLAISIAAATIFHEFAQELADFFILTEHCHIRPITALVVNFISGLSVMIGALIILTVDVSSNATGCILALGGGLYIYVAGVECWPRVRRYQTSVKDKALSILAFVTGVVPIGLVLLNHGHCD